MKAIPQEHTTHTLGAPEGWDSSRNGPCIQLPVTRSDGVYYSYWRLSWRERLSVLIGRPIRLCVASDGHLPVALDLER